MKLRWLFKDDPHALVLSAFIANVTGCLLIGVLIFSFGGFSSPGVGDWSWVGELQATLFIGFFAALYGFFIIFIFVVPLLAFLREIGFAGPVVALIIGATPGVAFGISSADSFYNILLFFGLVIALIFCALAYPRISIFRLLAWYRQL